jgi:parvulin-like peptidyl-prolyl isomerase
LSRLGSVLSHWSTAWSKLESDRRNGLLLFSGLGLVVLIAFLIIGYGYYNENIAYKNDTVLTVGARKFSYSEIERRLTYELKRGNLLNNSPNDAAIRALLLVQQDELTRQGAASLGISVSDQEIDDKLHGQLGIAADQPAAFASAFRDAVLRSGLTRSEYVEQVAEPLLEDKIRTYYSDQVPAEGDQVDLLQILTSDRASADDAKTRLDNGDAFADVAADVSIDASSSNGGDAGWIAQGALPPLVDKQAFSLDIGQTSDVIETTTFFYIVQPAAREVRPIDDNQRNDVVNQMLSNLIADTDERVGSVTSLRTIHLTKLADHALAVVGGG